MSLKWGDQEQSAHFIVQGPQIGETMAGQRPERSLTMAGQRPERSLTRAEAVDYVLFDGALVRSI